MLSLIDDVCFLSLIADYVSLAIDDRSEFCPL